MSERKNDSKTITHNFTFDKLDPFEIQITLKEKNTLLFIQAQNLLSKRLYRTAFKLSDIQKMGINKKLSLVFALLESLFEQGDDEEDEDSKLKAYGGYLPPELGEELKQRTPGENENGDEEDDFKTKIYSKLIKVEETGYHFIFGVDYKDKWNEESYIFKLIDSKRNELERLTDMVRDRKLEIQKLNETVTQLTLMNTKQNQQIVELTKKFENLKKYNTIVGIWRTTNSSNNTIRWNIPVCAPLSEYITSSNDDSKFTFRVSGIYRILVRIGFQGSTTRYLQLNISGEQKSLSFNCSQDSQEKSHQLSELVPIEAGKYLEIYANWDRMHTGKEYNYLSIEFVRELMDEKTK